MTTVSTPAPGGHSFDPADWLARFEENGGTIFFDECDKPALGFHCLRNSGECQTLARSMIAGLSTEQVTAVAEHCRALAASFQPADWCIAFNHAGGSVYAWEGDPWTGMPDQDDDRALRMRNRLLPSEVAKLRSFLRRHLGLGEAA